MKTNLDEEIYRSVPAEQKEELSRFRADHPYKQITVGGVRWEYIASGQGDETVLILGGAIAMGETAFKTILRLEDRFRVLSPSYPAEWKMGMIAVGLAAILKAEGVSQAHVFGHSLGAAAGHVFTRLCPDRVDKLVLDGFGLYTPGHVRFAKLFFKLPYGLLVAYYRRRINRLLAGANDPEVMFWQAYMEELLTRLHTRDTLMAQFRLLIDIFDHAGEYGVFRPVEKPGRVLLILAKDDRGFTQAEREALIASYPGAQVRWFTSGGHLSGFTRREEFNAVLDSFLLSGKITENPEEGEPTPRGFN